jgi:peroxiredoxin
VAQSQSAERPVNAWPWPAPVDDGGACHLRCGLAMPNVALPTTAGREVAFGRRQQRAIVFFYPWTGRPGVANPPNWDMIAGAHGSTPQAQDFGKFYSAFAAMGVSVFGVSTQSTDYQRELVERLRLPFELVSDSERKLQHAAKLPIFETGGVVYLKRLTLVLRDGRIERVFYPVHPPDAHAREVLAWLTSVVDSAAWAQPKTAGSRD